MKRGVELLVVLSVAALVWSTLVPAASVYRWVTEDGEIVYSDRRPDPGAELVEVRDLGTPGEDEDADDESAEAEARRAERCAEAERMLAQYEEASFLFREEEDGSETILTDTEREQEIERLRGVVERSCS